MSDAFQRSAESVPTRRVIGDMSAILEAARSVAGLVDLDHVLEHVVHQAAEIAGAELASCWLVDEAAYRRTDLFERRRVLMDDWAAYLAGAPREPEATTPRGNAKFSIGTRRPLGASALPPGPDALSGI